MAHAGDLLNPPVATDPRIPLANLAAIHNRVESLSRHLSNSVNSHTILPPHEMASISSGLISAIHQVIINGASLLASQSSTLPDPDPRPVNPDPTPVPVDDDGDFEIVEIDAVELLAEHIHFCEICGKGFKRDANLRMHMRAHGNKYKTLQALAKPGTPSTPNSYSSQLQLGSASKTRFSCPYDGCNRNQHSVNFRPLKSIICVKNHFKRSHCPKMYGCTRCNKKSFSVIADLKSHLRHCGEAKWKCSCGTSFTRKDKLFAHMALFDGHMPAIDAAAVVAARPVKGVVVEDEISAAGVYGRGGSGDGGGGMEFDELFQGFGGNMVVDEFFSF